MWYYATKYQLRNFDGVFSVETLPSMPRLLVCNRSFAHAGLTLDLYTGVENISNLSVDDQTRFIERYLNRHCSSWIFNDSQLQVLLVNFVDITVYISAYSVTEE